MRELDGTLFGPGQPCFGCSPDHSAGFRLRFRVEGEGEAREAVTTFTPGEQYQGPPGIMHGGLVTALADEVAAWTVIATTEKFGFTAEIACKLRKPVRIGVALIARGRIVRASTRTVKVHVGIIQAGEECFTGDFAFVLLDRAAAETLLGQALPPAWEPFAR